VRRARTRRGRLAAVGRRRGRPWRRHRGRPLGRAGRPRGRGRGRRGRTRSRPCAATEALPAILTTSQNGPSPSSSSLQRLLLRPPIPRRHGAAFPFLLPRARRLVLAGVSTQLISLKEGRKMRGTREGGVTSLWRLVLSLEFCLCSLPPGEGAWAPQR
jgi:hypothetical protein